VPLRPKKIKVVLASAGQNRAKIESYSAKMKTEQQRTRLGPANEDKRRRARKLGPELRRQRGKPGALTAGPKSPSRDFA
jgi:hypothetical protein